MAQKFDFVKWSKQAKIIDDTVEGIRKKMINCDIGNGDATEALSALDSEVSEIESSIDFLQDSLTQEVQDLQEKNSEVRKFIDDLESKIEKLESLARANRSPQNIMDTPVSNGRGYHPRFLK